jgi:hypothetical protein
MPSKLPADRLREIEETQVALRKSIEQSRQLADKSQELLDKHRRGLKNEPEPRSVSLGSAGTAST